MKSLDLTPEALEAALNGTELRSSKGFTLEELDRKLISLNKKLDRYCSIPCYSITPRQFVKKQVIAKELAKTFMQMVELQPSYKNLPLYTMCSNILNK